MTASISNLFPSMSLGGDTDDPKEKLRKLLDGINRGTKVEIAAPITQPQTEIQPRQPGPLPVDPSTAVTPTPTPAGARTYVEPLPPAGRGKYPGLSDPTPGPIGEMLHRRMVANGGSLYRALMSMPDGTADRGGNNWGNDNGQWDGFNRSGPTVNDPGLVPPYEPFNRDPGFFRPPITQPTTIPIQSRPMQPLETAPVESETPIASQGGLFRGDGSQGSLDRGITPKTAFDTNRTRLRPTAAPNTDPDAWRGDAGLDRGATWTNQDEALRARTAKQADNANTMAAANRYIGAGPLATDETGGYSSGRAISGAAPTGYDEPNPPGYKAPVMPYKQPALNTSADTSAYAQKIDSGALDKELGIKPRSLASRLFRGLGRGWQQWGKEDGAFGLFDMFGEGVKGATDKNYDMTVQRQNKERPLFRQLGQQQQQEAFNAKQATEQAQAANYNSEVAARNNQAIRDRNKEIADAAKTTLEKNKATGEWFNRTADGKLAVALHPVTGKPMTDKDIVQHLADGTPFFTTGDDQADREAKIALEQAHMDFQAKQLNQADLDKYEQDVTKWATDSADHQQKVSKLILDGEALQNEAVGYENQAARTIDRDKKAELTAQANAARSKGAALVTQGNEARSKGPKKPTRPAANLTAPNLSGGAYKGQVFNSDSIDKIYATPPPALKGKTKAQIKEYLQANGGTVQ